MLPDHLEDYNSMMQVLDHGFVRLVDVMGDDPAIVQAARVSYGPGTKTGSEDRALIRYLYRQQHTTPFEMCEIKLHCKMPIFVARQWIRHRTASVNEMSGRYSILPQEFYIPEPENVGVQSPANKQGRGHVVKAEEAQWLFRLFKEEGERQYKNYLGLLNDDGEGNPVDEYEPMVAREIARMGLGLNYYTEWYWKIDLHNLLHFLSLRMDEHAQFEFRQYANVVGEIVEAWCPMAWAAFNDYHPRRNARTFSAQEMALLKHIAKAAFPEGKGTLMKDLADRFDIGTKRERKEFWESLGGAPMSDDFITDGDILGVLEKLKPGESIDADGIARTLNVPHLNTSIGFRMYYLINQGYGAYAEENSEKWYVAGPKLKEKKT